MRISAVSRAGFQMDETLIDSSARGSACLNRLFLADRWNNARILTSGVLLILLRSRQSHKPEPRQQLGTTTDPFDRPNIRSVGVRLRVGFRESVSG
jgi:hypothetical protein